MNSEGLFNEQVNKCSTVGYILWIYSKQSRDAVKQVWCQLSKKKKKKNGDRLKKVLSSRERVTIVEFLPTLLDALLPPSSANAFYGVKFKSSGATLS